MNATERKAARMSILHELRNYAKALRASEHVRFAENRRPFDFDDALRESYGAHCAYLGALTLAHNVGLIKWGEYDRFSALSKRIRTATVTRGIPIAKRQRAAA